MFKKVSKTARVFGSNKTGGKTFARKADAGASFVVKSAEGTMRFSGFEGPEGARLRQQVRKRRDRLFGPGESHPASRA